MRDILALGAASFLSQRLIVLSMAAMPNVAVKYGAMDEIFGQPEYSQIPTVVIGIVMKFFQIIISVAAGLAAGCIPVAGYNIGAGRKDRVKELMKRLMTAEEQAEPGRLLSMLPSDWQKRMPEGMKKHPHGNL